MVPTTAANRRRMTPRAQAAGVAARKRVVRSPIPMATLCVAVALAAAPGCGRDSAAQVRPSPSDPSPVARPVCRRAPSRGEVSAAMLAVYAHVLGLPAEPPPPELEPIPLRRAAEILVCDAEASPFGESRRRRAIARLAVAGLKLHDDFAFDLGHRSFLTDVGADIPAIEGYVRDVIDDLRGVRLLPAVVFPLLIARLQLSLLNFLNSGGYAVCAVQNLTTPPPPSTLSGAPDNCNHPDSSWKSGTTWVTTSLETTRSVPDLAKLLDPQNWDDPQPAVQCNKYFEQACAFDLAAGKCLECPPTPGRDWSGMFFEKFKIVWNPFGETGGGESRFHTVLSIAADATPDSDPTNWAMTFCFKQSTYAKVGNNDSGSLDVDEGLTLVEPPAAGSSSGWNRVTAHKMIRFAGWQKLGGGSGDAAMNFAASVLLTEMGEALNERVCCGAPDAPSCAPTPPVLIP